MAEPKQPKFFSPYVRLLGAIQFTVDNSQFLPSAIGKRVLRKTYASVETKSRSI